MEQEKNNKGVNLLLVILVAVLAVLCVLFATGTINLKSNEVTDGNGNQSSENTKTSIKENNGGTNQSSNSGNETINSVSTVAGKYQYKDDSIVDFENKPNPTTFTLNLYENGTFRYQLNDQYAPVGSIGNYIVENDKIILNYLFNTGSSSDINTTKGTKEFTFDSHFNIIGSVKSKDHKSNINVIFKKSSDNVDEFDFNTWLMIGVHQQEKLDDANM